MGDNGKISSLQLGYLIFTYLSGFATLYMLEIKMLGTDAWMSILFATLGSLLLLGILLYIQRQFPEQTIFEYTEQLVGKWIGKGLMIIFLYYCFELCMLTSKALTVFYTTAIMPKTPSYVFNLLIFIVTTYAAYLGLETIGRAAQIILPLAVISLTAVCVLIASIIDINPFLPMFQRSWNEIAYTSLSTYAFPFSKVIVFAAVFARVKDKEAVSRNSMIAIILAGIYFFSATYLTIGSINPYLASIKTYPFFTAISMVRIGDDIERFEIVSIGFWTMLVIFEGILALYVAMRCIQYLFSLPDTKWLHIPTALLLFGLSEKSFANGSASIIEFDYTTYPYTSLIPTTIIPLILLIMTIVKKRAKK
ncbi:spore germination protein [Paenibacillus sp. SC116]|uniref:GerAB/ArcD/ProY family transporter n=1 Tax=Paenibacillus sp. SC116 TaxID=2968986 RepID=UPI00215A48A7|nr:spore germination protein [Paenibacillus sp. SC116]MCR8842167.1 spore germination protein [Paenibacillus sp. SC116]